MPQYSGAYRDSRGRIRPITAKGSRMRVHGKHSPASKYSNLQGSLTTAERNALPDSDFAIPKERKYPIEDANHARNALARVSANGTPEEKRQVCEAVHKRYPEIHAESCPVHSKAGSGADPPSDSDARLKREAEAEKYYHEKYGKVEGDKIIAREREARKKLDAEVMKMHKEGKSYHEIFDYLHDDLGASGEGAAILLKENGIRFEDSRPKP